MRFTYPPLQPTSATTSHKGAIVHREIAQRLDGVVITLQIIRQEGKWGFCVSSLIKARQHGNVLKLDQEKKNKTDWV